jgi:hypothetical protein
VRSTSDNNVRLGAISTVIREVVAKTHVNLMDLRQVSNWMPTGLVCVKRVVQTLTLRLASQDAVNYELTYNHNTAGEPLEYGILTRDMFHPCQSHEPPCPDGSYGNLLIANTLARTLMAAVQYRNQH